MKKYIISLAFLAVSCIVMAQSGTNSPYSMYGLGKIADQSQGFNRGMNGVGLGFREHNQVNYLNPASYSAIDSVTFILDAGMSLQTANFKEDGKSYNANNADFEYAVMSFRAMRHLGVSVGILPYSNVGYNFSTPPQSGVNTSVTNTTRYSGSGGLHQLFIGAGYQFFPGFSAGFNASYFWGYFTNGSVTSFSEANVRSITTLYATEAHSYKLDFGAQYTHKLGNNDQATIGVTYSPGHSLGNTPECAVSISDTTTAYTSATKIPTQLGVGLTWTHRRKLKVGLDYTMMKWSSISVTEYVVPKTGEVFGYSDNYVDRHKFNVGGEYCADENSRNFKDRIRYRFGVGYATPYYKIRNGNELRDGAKEISVSAGVGIPIVNTWNNRSTLNVSLKWTNMSAKNLLTENTLMLNIGLTFNERWFAKWKFE